MFNRQNREESDSAFPRTFYPNVPNREGAVVIHLKEGQRILNADIHVANPPLTRQVTMHLDWNGRNPQSFTNPYFAIKANPGMVPFPHPAGPGTYSLRVSANAQYSIHAEAACKRELRAIARTDEVTLDGGDNGVSVLTLTLNKGACDDKPVAH